MTTVAYLRDQLEHGVEKALKTREAGECFPHVGAFFRDDEALAVVFIGEWTDANKGPMLRMLARLGRELAADSVTFTSDVWVDATQGVRPIDDPTRLEAIQAFAVLGTDVVASRAAFYETKGDGIVLTGVEETWIHGGPGDSWLIDALATATTNSRKPISMEGINTVAGALTVVFGCAVMLAGSEDAPHALR